MPRTRFNGDASNFNCRILYGLTPLSRPARGTRMRAEQVKKIAVIGAGTMGAGIAQTCAAAGFQVTMRDIEQRLVDGGFRRIRDPLMKRAEKGKMATSEVEAIVSKIRGVVDLKDAVAGAQV